MGPGQKFLTQVESIFSCLGQVGSAIFGLGLKISPKNTQIFQFFPSGSKKIFIGRVEKYPGQGQVGLLFNLLRVKSMLGFGSGPTSPFHALYV